MRFSRPRLVAALVATAISTLVEAQTTWTGTGGNTTFSNTANWNNNLAPANTGTASVAFGNTGFGAVNVDTSYSLNSITLNSTTTNYTFSGSALSIASAITSSTPSGISSNFNDAIQLTGSSAFSTGSSNLTFSAINTGSHGLILSSTGGALTVTGNITGNGALTVSGNSPGVVFLGGASNTYSGGTTINSGAVLQYGDPGGTLSISIPGNVTDNGQLNIKPINTPYTYTGVISGTGTLYQLGTNVLTLQGKNTYAGQTVIAAGTLQIGVNNALPVTTSLSMNGTNGAVLNVAYDQAIDHFGPNSAGSSITIQSGKTFTVSAASSATSSSYFGTISGSGQLEIEGVSGSKFNLTQTTPFAGATNVESGQLGIHNASGNSVVDALSGAVTVYSGASIEGKGGISGSLMLNTGATITVDPKFSVGPTTFNGGTTYNMLLANATGASGTDYSLLSVSGVLALGTASSAIGNQITIRPVSFNGSSPGQAANFDTTQSYSFILASTTAGITGFNAANFAVDLTNFQNAFTGTWSVAQAGNNLDLIYTGGAAIPEPAMSELLFGCLALGIAFCWRLTSSRP